ncbi:MAG TPA: HAMP domain-containing sensor histidine kinase [Vicinamibacterales bacterium]|nr:HAMP domain-containing sensor histidine kinase [Vicinamibacterales bacterium]
MPGSVRSRNSNGSHDLASAASESGDYLSVAHACARLGALAVAGLGAVVLVGWIFDITILKTLAPGLTSMKANTAGAFIATGLALFLIVTAPASRRSMVVARTLAIFAMLVGGLTLAAYVFTIDLGIDQLVFSDISIRYPGRMAPTTTIAFLCVGSALLALTVRSSRALAFATWVGVTTLATFTLALIGYAYGVTSLYRMSSYASVALLSAIGFWILSLALLAANPTRGFVATILSDTSGGLAARQLLPTIPLLLFAIGWLCLLGEQAGAYGARFGFSLVVILTVVVSLLAIASTATRLHRVDLRRQEAADDVAALNIGLQQQNVALESASRTKSEFLSTMSHELRTPLTAIIGYSEVLRDGLVGDMTEEQRGFVNDIATSGRHLLSLINDILDLSRVEAGSMRVDAEPVLISSLCEIALSTVREEAALRQVLVEFEPTADLGLVQADSRKIRQVLYNLLSNAIKFTGAGGRVTLHVARVPRSGVGELSGDWPGRSFPLPATDAAEFVEMRVTDTGIGMSSDGMERLFKPFSQLDSGLARKYAGTGLGLALVKILVDLHAGTEAVESLPGEGARFTIWLPLQPAVAAAVGSPRT